MALRKAELQVEHGVLRSVVLILKQFLAERNLGISYTGGLSSYGLILMVVQSALEGHGRFGLLKS